MINTHVTHMFSFVFRNSDRAAGDPPWPVLPWPIGTINSKSMRPRDVYLSIKVVDGTYAGRELDALTQVNGPIRVIGPRIKADHTDGASVSLNFYNAADRFVPDFVKEIVTKAKKEAWLYMHETTYDFNDLARGDRTLSRCTECASG